MAERDENKPCKATDSKTLREQIMSESVSKNEREWWAKRRIEELESQSPMLNEEKLREVLENVFPEVFPSFYHRLHWLDKIFKALKTREKEIIRYEDK